MIYIVTLFLFILMNAGLRAQDIKLPERNVCLVILDKKGKPADKVIVRSVSNTHAGMTDNKGCFVFTGITDDDRISIYLPQYGETVVPVAGMDSIVVQMRSARRYSYRNSEGQSVLTDKKNKTEASDLIDVQVLLAQHPYTSLVDLLRGANVAGLNITPASTASGNASANIRGERSFTLSSEPLVVVDGLPTGTLSDANNILNIYDIRTIEVQKSSSEWGIRGANGVIIIKTK